MMPRLVFVADTHHGVGKQKKKSHDEYLIKFTVFGEMCKLNWTSYLMNILLLHYFTLHSLVQEMCHIKAG